MDPETRKQLDKLCYLYFEETLLNPANNILCNIYRKDPVAAGKQSHKKEQEESGQAAKKMKDKKMLNDASIFANAPSGG